MNLYIMLLLIFIFFSFLFVTNSVAIPTCTFRSGSCSGGETCIFEVLQENNSHVGSCDSDYNIKICCTEITSATIRTGSCNSGEDTILTMYQTSNSHAGSKTNYNNLVCARTANSPVLTTIRSSCLSRENCAFTTFQQNNTHVGRCNYYTNLVCIQQRLNNSITIILNVSDPNWNQSVGMEGVFTRSDGTAVDTSSDADSDLEVYLNSSLICRVETNSTGGYTCNFTAPASVGLYELNVTADDPTTSLASWNSTTFAVKQIIGEPQITAEQTSESIACYEEPRIVQNPDGTIEVAVVRICVFK